jgi:DHA2 family methylenomycin A resistance protein-like MFS transporter
VTIIFQQENNLWDSPLMSYLKPNQSTSPRLTLIATSLGLVLVTLDVTVVNVALERIQASLSTNVTGLQWIINAYTLVFASLLLTAGAIGDRFGAKRIFVIGFALFTIASLACGTAGTISTLIAGRIVQGVGAALCVPASLALLSASFPEAASRARAVSIWAGVGGLALAAGPVVGGIMVDRVGWPSIFFLNLPLGLLGIWLTLSYAPSGSKTPNRGLDLAGQVLAILALGGLTLGFVESGALGWTHPLVLSGFTCFLVAGALFLLAEARGADPMLPLSLFRSSVVSASCVVGLLTNFAYYGLMFVLSLFFQATKGYSPLMTGLAFLPMTALVTVANLISGRLTARFGPRLSMVMGQALAACGYLTLAGIDGRTPYSVIVGPLLAAGIGVALTVPAMTTAVLASADRQRTGITSGALNAARQTGGVIGVGVFGSFVAGGPEKLLAGMQVALILAALALGIGAIISFVSIKVRLITKSTSLPVEMITKGETN